MSTATRKSTSEATFKNVIEDIVKHRESQLRLKRLLIENTFDSDELENSSHDVFNTWNTEFLYFTTISIKYLFL